MLQGLPSSPKARASPAPPPNTRPPLPLRLSLTTTTPPSTHTDEISELEEDSLPSYAQLEASAPLNSRFGRWGGWVEKRAIERRNEARERTGWTLEEGPGKRGIQREVLNQEPESRSETEQRRPEQWAETGFRTGAPAGHGTDRSIQQNTTRVTNPDPAEGEQLSTSTSAASSPLIKSGFGIVPLTASASMYPIGSRFMKHIPEKPLCGAVLPVSNKVLNGLNMERFILVGTEEGLYLTDLVPTLASGALQTQASSISDAIILQLWSGLGVLQLNVYIEEGPYPQSGMRGVVFALVRQSVDFHSEIRMWSLQTLINLAKYRCSSESSKSVVMSPLRPPSPVDPKRTSKAFFKSFVSKPSHDEKGKSKAVPPPERHGSDDSFVMVDSLNFPGDRSSRGSTNRESSEAQIRERTWSESSGPSIATTPSTAHTLRHLLSHSATPSIHNLKTSPSVTLPLNEDSTTSLPLEWASASAPFPLPKNHGSVLFFHLASPPLPDRPSPTSQSEGIPRSNHLLLAVATTKVIYVYESRPAERRTWVLAHEFYAPTTPRFLHFVNLSSSTTSNLAVMLGTRSKCVVVKLSDLSVREIRMERPRSSTSSSVSGSVKTRSQKRASVTPGSRVASYVTSLVESRQGGIPAGMRGEQGGLELGRRVTDIASILEPGDEDLHWTGISELFLNISSSSRASGETHLRRCFFLTRGCSTHLLFKPFSSPSSPSTSSTESESTFNTIRPRSAHVFEWESPVTHVVASIRTTTLKPSVASTHFHLVLVGFTRTGLLVQEGLLSKSTTESHFSPRDLNGTDLPPLFSSIRSQPGPNASPFLPETSTSESSELDGEASLDFGNEIGFLCLGGPWWNNLEEEGDEEDDESESDSGDSNSKGLKRKAGAGCLFFTSGRVEHTLRWVG